MSKLRLGLNIDHVATLRNARGGFHPDPVEAARLAIACGVDGITAHLREDRRHITDDDIFRLQELCLETNVPLNMELAAVDEMADIAERLKPHAVCIVPEKRTERTTEGGLDIAGKHNIVTPVVRRLADNGSRVSLFIEALPHQVEAAASSGAAVVEFHTGAYAHALDENNQDEAAEKLIAMLKGAQQAADLGLEVHFGHGLTYDNVKPIAAIPQAMELNIGHFLMGESMFIGLPNVIDRIRKMMDDARQTNPS